MSLTDAEATAKAREQVLIEVAAFGAAWKYPKRFAETADILAALDRNDRLQRALGRRDGHKEACGTWSCGDAGQRQAELDIVKAAIEAAGS